MIDLPESAKPLLSTERFELFKPTASDLAGHCRLLADAETRRFLGPARADPHAQFERLTRNAGSWALYGYGTFAVRKKGDVELIASCGIFHSYRGFAPNLKMDNVPEAGWIVRADHGGQGISREVMDAVLPWFDAHYGPRRIVCMIEEGNHASERVAHHLDFRRYASTAAEVSGSPSLLHLYERLPSS